MKLIMFILLGVMQSPRDVSFVKIDLLDNERKSSIIDPTVFVDQILCWSGID